MRTVEEISLEIKKLVSDNADVFRKYSDLALELLRHEEQALLLRVKQEEEIGIFGISRYTIH